MSKDYKSYLEEELTKAVKVFENVKAETIKEIERMTFITAEDFGVAYASHIDKVTKAASKITTLRETLSTFNYFEKKDNEAK